MDAPPLAAILLVQRDDITFARAHDDETFSGTRATGERQLGAHTPQCLARLEIPRLDCALVAGREHVTVVRRDPEAEPELLALAAHARIPGALHAQARGEVRELSRGFDVFGFVFLRARAERSEQRGHGYGK